MSKVWWWVERSKEREGKTSGPLASVCYQRFGLLGRSTQLGSLEFWASFTGLSIPGLSSPCFGFMDPVEGPQNAASEWVLWMEAGRNRTVAGFQALLLQLGPTERFVSESLISRSHFVLSHPDSSWWKRCGLRLHWAMLWWMLGCY